MIPNIFSFAKKELSQDAFLAWLITWAHPVNKEYDAQLHECAQDFVRQLLGEFAINSNLKVDSVRVEMQWSKIDVCAKISSEDKKYLIIIEDKVGSIEHSNQLVRYKQTAQEWSDRNDFELHCVYLKTGNEPSDSLKYIEKNDYRIFSRNHMLELVRKYEKIENNILTDFRINLESIEKSFINFSNKPIGNNWNGNDWVGLFKELDEQQLIIRWHYVSNPAGGFQNALLNWHSWNGVCVYAQLEEGKLCYKISFNQADTKSDLKNMDLDKLQDEWQKILLLNSEKYSEENEVESVKAIRRPKRYLHKGTWRTIAVVDRKDWLGQEGELLDINQVVTNLNAHKKFIKGCLTQ